MSMTEKIVKKLSQSDCTNIKLSYLIGRKG